MVFPDDITVSLLSKLDVRDVCRFRCVCRRWKDLTSDEYFVESLRSHSAPMIFMGCNSWNVGIGSNYLLDNYWEDAPRKINGGTPFYQKDYWEDKYFQLYARGCHNGFIFFSWGTNKFSIINPINGDQVGNPYLKIPKVEYKMLNLGFKTCWRGIGNSSYEAEVLSKCAVFVEDFSYWIVRLYDENARASHRPKAIMVFDIKTEELSLMPLPCDCNTNYLHNADGFLSVSGMITNGVNISLKIWTMKDRENKLWTSSKYDVSYVKHLKRPYMEEIADIIDGHVLFRSSETGSEILVGSLKHGTARKFVCNSNRGWVNGVFYLKPSLSSLKKCKPVICLDVKNKEDLIEAKVSSKADLNIVVEDILDGRQIVHTAGV